MPSSSARCAQLPRAADKVPFYAALKKFRDYLNGIVTNIDDSEVVFSDSRLKGCCESESKADSLYSMDLMDISNAIVKREGDMIPCKKKRGRPKKIKTEGEEVKPVVRKVAQSQNVNNCDFPKKKRGRPKKNKCEDIDVSMHERNTRTPITKCFSTPSPIHSPNFCHINPPMASSNSSSSGMYNNNNGGSTMPLTPVHQQPYSQSPRPHSQPFTHSDLSSEISAAISSDHLGSPAPTSPSLGPPDFDPPTSMPTEDTTTECRFSSPTPSTASEQQNQSVATPYSTNYHTFGIDNERFGQGPVNNSMQVRPSSVSDYKVQDMSSKSLSGLESLVDQIPSIADGETGVHNGSNPGMHIPDANDQYSSVYSGYVGISAPGPGTPTRSGLTNSPGPVSSPGPQNYNYNSYGSLSVASLTGGSGSNSFNNYGHHTPPSPTNSYHPMMGQSHSFMEHHGCPMPLSPYTQLPPPYGHQQFANSYPPAPPGIHMPSPNYPPGPPGPPPPYYNTGYPQTQAGSPHYHMFDRIKPDIGYGSF